MYVHVFPTAACSGEILPQRIVYGLLCFDMSSFYLIALLITTPAQTRKTGNTLYRNQHVEWYLYSIAVIQFRVSFQDIMTTDTWCKKIVYVTKKLRSFNSKTLLQIRAKLKNWKFSNEERIFPHWSSNNLTKHFKNRT